MYKRKVFDGGENEMARGPAYFNFGLLIIN